MSLSYDAVQEYQKLISKANEYHRKALWQEKLRVLQEALAICEEPGFPEVQQRKQELCYDVAGIWRRLSQYDRAQEMLQQSLDAYPGASLSFRASVLGELGVMARHNTQYRKALEAFREQGRLARQAPPGIEADAEICRAIGNEGMATFNLWQQQTRPRRDIALLALASTQQRERITRAQALQQRLSREAPESKYIAMAETWEVIGMDRLTLCHVAAGETAAAVAVAEESQRLQLNRGGDPTVMGFSRFFYGNALWHHGRRAEALEQWNAPLGTCSSPMALCKEPGAEFDEYLRLMATAGVNFDSYDEQGFSALDHAVFSDSPNARGAIPIIEEALRKTIRCELEAENPGMPQDRVQDRIEEEIALRKRQAQLRRQYRTILQEHIRPELRIRSSESFRKLRVTCARFLSENDAKQRRMFSSFHFVNFVDFVRHGKLPISTSGLTQTFQSQAVDRGMPLSPTVVGSTATTLGGKDNFIIFLSYRWIGGSSPDDENHTQWRRMKDAVDKLLVANPHIQRDQVDLWLDYACIDQENPHEKERGVDALPLAVLQCNAMISLVDETYYERAWCAVEAMLMRALVDSYGLHQWWEYSSTNGSLSIAKTDRVFDVDKLKLTNEKLDRPKIDFLMRQSKLLGRDKA